MTSALRMLKQETTCYLCRTFPKTETVWREWAILGEYNATRCSDEDRRILGAEKGKNKQGQVHLFVTPNRVLSTLTAGVWEEKGILKPIPASKLGVVRPAGICIKPQPRERRVCAMLPQGSEQTEEQTLQGRSARLSTGTEEVTLTINSLNSSL